MSEWLTLPDYPARFKIKRIPTGKTVSGKRYLTQQEVGALFSGDVVIEEKIDGKQVCKRLSLDGRELVLCGEFTKFTHTIYYDSLPSWFVVWDIYDVGADRMIPLKERRALAAQLNIPLPHVIYEGGADIQKVLSFLDRQSSFSTAETQEGVVVKNYTLQMFGKVVRHEFISGIELKGHWMRRKGLVKMNRLAVSNQTKGLNAGTGVDNQ